MIIRDFFSDRPCLRWWMVLTLLGSAAEVMGVTVSRGPYLQNASHTNVTVCWRTDLTTDSIVRYGTNLSNLDLVTSDATSLTEHEIKLTGLLPDTTYFYSVGSGVALLAGSNENHFFVTAPLPGTPKPTRIWAIGDFGWANPSQLAVRNAYESFTGSRHTDVWLTLGDNAYPSGTDANYQAGVFNIYTNLLRKSVVWPSRGNHDSDTAYLSIFSLPKAGEAGGFPSGTESYYSFNHANIHFICLDSAFSSRTTNSPMYAWLTNDLAQVTADWTIAYWHHPPYNQDAFVDAREMRQVFLPVLEQAGVDLVLCGHIHNYLRTFLLDQYYAGRSEFNATNKLDVGSGREDDTGAYKKPEGGPIPHRGTVYAVVGSSGTIDFLPNTFHPAVYAVGNTLGSLVLDIVGNRLDAKFITSTGATNDYFTILKTNAAETNVVFSITNAWRYWQTGSLDGVNWKAPDFDDSGWPSGRSLFYSTTAALPAPTNTPLVLGQRTYYFRTHFTYSGGAPEITLEFSSLIDDGAVFYLNGVEIRRVGMHPGTITYTTLPTRSVGNAMSFDQFTISSSLLTNLVLGDNVLAVELHQEAEEDAESQDLVFGATLSLATGISAQLTRGPYVQNGSHTNLTVRWRTDAASNSRVRYGTNLANLDLIADGPVTAEHEVVLKNLQPQTRYFYSVGSTAITLVGGDTNHFFVTAPLPDERQPTRIWAIGDFGWGNAGQLAVRDAYKTFTGARHTDVWLMLGDNAYSAGLDSQYQTKVFEIYTNLFRQSVAWPTLGNHDTAQLTAFVDTYPYFNIFTLPANGEAGGVPSGTEHFYSFNHANIHFICLDSMTADRTTNGPMYAWLTNDLAQKTADWTIAYWHHPPYNLDLFLDAREMREVFLPILEQGGTDMVLCGHIHSYLRTSLIDQYYGNWDEFSATNKLDAGSGREDETGAYKKPEGGQTPHRGTVYAIVGSSGEVRPVPDPLHPTIYAIGNTLGSLVLDVAGNRLDAKFITSTGATNDYFTILKTNAPPVFDSISDQHVEANRALVLTNFASDFMRPGEQLNFSLLSAPSGASIRNLSTTNAVFSWVPVCEQGGTANVITIQVRDNGTPPLTATQTFAVTVADCVQVNLGDAVVRAGDTVSVPVNLLSTVPLSNVVMTATYPAERFTDAMLQINPQQIANNSFAQSNIGVLELGLVFQTNHTLRLSTNVAILSFTSVSNQSSAFEWVTLPEVKAHRLDGSVVTNAYGLSGRVAVVGEEPLLEALRAPGNQVLLLQYGIPGSSIGLEWATNLSDRIWQRSPPVTQTNMVQEAGTFTPSVSTLFFRALRGTNEP